MRRCFRVLFILACLVTYLFLQTSLFPWSSEDVFSFKKRNAVKKTSVIIDERGSDDSTSQNNSILVLLNGQLRGGNIAWNSFQHYLLNFYDADLAYIGPPLQMNTAVSQALQKRAKWVWEYDDPNDWATYFVRPTSEKADRSTLLTYCTVPVNGEQFLGGVKLGGVCRHEGSAGMLLSYRRLAQEKLIENKLYTKYQWIIYSRADYFYLCSPPELVNFNPTSVYIPKGEGYGGVTDRLHFIPGYLAPLALNITNHILSKASFWMKASQGANLEQLLKNYFEETNIPVRFFDHVAFTIRAEGDSSSWGPGSGFAHHSLSKFKVRPKYINEFYDALETCVQLKLKAEVFQSYEVENNSAFSF